MSTTAPTRPAAYRPSQILLHWFVLIGIVVQIAIHEPMVRQTEAVAAGLQPDPADSLLATAHATLGTAILVAVLARLWLRFRYGAPGHAPGTSPAQASAAGFVHAALYALLLGMAATGMITNAGVADLGDVHFAINVTMILLVVLHAGAALYNQFVRKDGTLARMRIRR